MNLLCTAPNITKNAVGMALAALCASALLSGPASAQGVYRIVGQDGRVTYSDVPPANNADAAPVGSATANTAASANARLPLALRQIVNRYAVVLHTGKDCSPCNAGRNLLEARGIPFSEKTVSSTEDIDALKRISGDLTLPFLTIGNQQLKGFSDGEWTQYLDAAGYPLQSSLPRSYRRPTPEPMVEAKAAAADIKEAAKSINTQSPQSTPVVPPAGNPSGIRF